MNDSAHTLDKDANGEWKHHDDRVWEDGLEGENIIHVGVSTGGEDVFWGHLIDRQTFRTMDTWFRKMRNWKSEDDSLSGTPRLKEWVRYPSAGLD